MNRYPKFTALAVLSVIGTPAMAGFCDPYSGDLHNYCHAYCEVQLCHTASPGCSRQSCEGMAQAFFSHAGYPLPCIETPVIQIVKTTNGLTQNCAANYDLITGSKVTWDYTITNKGNTPVVISSITDTPTLNGAPTTGPTTITCNGVLGTQSSVGSNTFNFSVNNKLTLNPCLFQEECSNNSIVCQGTGTVQAGFYSNMVSVNALDSNGALSTIETADSVPYSSYVGVTPNISVSLSNSANPAVTAACSNGASTTPTTITWTVTVTNSGQTPLTGISYLDSSANTGKLTCPSDLLPGVQATCTYSEAVPSSVCNGTQFTETDSIQASGQYTDSNNDTTTVTSAKVQSTATVNAAPSPASACGAAIDAFVTTFENENGVMSGGTWTDTGGHGYTCTGNISNTMYAAACSDINDNNNGDCSALINNLLVVDQSSPQYESSQIAGNLSNPLGCVSNLKSRCISGK